jgi:hypothetical protein
MDLSGLNEARSSARPLSSGSLFDAFSFGLRQQLNGVGGPPPSLMFLHGIAFNLLVSREGDLWRDTERGSFFAPSRSQAIEACTSGANIETSSHAYFHLSGIVKALV